MESFLANDLKARFALASGKHKGNAFNDRKTAVPMGSGRWVMCARSFSGWGSPAASPLCVPSTIGGFARGPAACRFCGPGGDFLLSPAGRLQPGKSCDVLGVSVCLLFPRFGYKNLLVSNCDTYYGLSFTVRIMFSLATKAPSVLIEEETLAALPRNCFRLLSALFPPPSPALAGPCSISWPLATAVWGVHCTCSGWFCTLAHC